MNKILLIISREYLTRVKKRSFLVMTILGPLLIASIVIVPVYLAKISDEAHTVGILDETGIFFETFVNSSAKNLTFVPVLEDITTAKEKFDERNFHALLYIPKESISSPSIIRLFAKKQVSPSLTSVIENILQKEIESHKLAISGIDKSVLETIKTPISLNTIVFTDKGDETFSYVEMNTILGLISGILIYIFIFSFGAQVMRGVIEEKTSRIVEIIVSSVKPFQLMMGKIIGIAFVGLTQFLLWILLSFLIVTGFQMAKPDMFVYKEKPTVLLESKGLAPQEALNIQTSEIAASDKGNQILEGIKSINFPLVISLFLFYFIFGYFMYASLFAAIGSAVDNETDTQQFMLPITVPLIISIAMIQFVVNNPDGSVSFWLSMIPLTSPVIMMVRIPFGVHWTEVLASMTLLVSGFIFSTWFAGKIYRTGILMYGKKTSYREIWKWLKHK